MVQPFRHAQRTGYLQQKQQRRNAGEEWNSPAFSERTGIRSVFAEQDFEFAVRIT
jgi:hypothetical protein